jgi:hypothetical protein
MDILSIAQAVDLLRKAPIDEVAPFVDDFILQGHYDAFPWTLSDGRRGVVRLSKWPICWSVKWYAEQGREQIMLIDRVNEATARDYFDRLRDELESGEATI